MIGRFFTWLLAPGQRWQWWFWGLVLLEAIPLGDLEWTSLGDSLTYRGIGMLTKIPAAYILAYYIVPMAFRRRYLRAAAVFLISTIVFTVAARWLNVHIAEPLAGLDIHRESLYEMVYQLGQTYSNYILRVYFFAFLFNFVKLGVDEMRAEQQLTELREEKTATELSLLKAQIHPHFLFNTLNNLYALTLDKDDAAPVVVEKLSGMLDYLLYQSQAERVPLSKEVDLLRNFGALEALRFCDRLRWQLKTDIDDSAATIAPMLLISPLENAFKHGARPTNGAAKITATVSLREGQLLYSVLNTVPAGTAARIPGAPEGIGLSNVRRQLDLQYPERHTLEVKTTDENYQLTMRISL